MRETKAGDIYLVPQVDFDILTYKKNSEKIQILKYIFTKNYIYI